jgi:5,10-methylenetetrahydromethanopterin reductase
VVRRAEELGFVRAWFYDTQMLSADPFVAMAAAAIKTTKIRLGTGVLIPSNRIAAVAANAFASLNKLAPGRIDFGVGTGFTGRRAMGWARSSSPIWRNTFASLWHCCAGKRSRPRSNGRSG